MKGDGEVQRPKAQGRVTKTRNKSRRGVGLGI